MADGGNVYLLVDSRGPLITKAQYRAVTFKVVDAVAGSTVSGMVFGVEE